MRNKRLIPTRAQRIQQRVVDWLLSLDSASILLISWITVLVLAVCALIYVLLNPNLPQCIEGYVYMRGICVQGYKP